MDASTSTVTTAPRAYSYRRFSTPAQATGDSLRRQTAMAEAWAKRNGVTLDSELAMTDRGISAYSGANKDVGALGAFLKAVEAGEVMRGSYLLVENLDRLSREPAFDASYTLQGIVRAGVTVVDLSDGSGREYNEATLRSPDGLMHMMAMLLSFARGNQESAMKAQRVSAAYANKRAVFASAVKLEKPYTHKLPAWIRWNAAIAEYELINERADRLRWMFEIAAEGEGTHSIAAQLNAANVETWGAGGWQAKYWHRSYVRKLLTNKAAIGIFTPHRVTKAGGKQQRTALEPIANRFPAAVSRELFEAVNARLATTAPRGRNATAPVRNIFAGVMKCEMCGGTVTMQNKGEHVYLVCSVARAKAGLHRNWSVPYAEAVQAFKRGLPAMLRDAPRGNDGATLQARIEQLEVEIDAGEDAINELLELSISERSTAARAKLRQYEAELETLRAEHRRVTEKREASTNTNVKVRLEAITKAFAQEKGDIADINRALRSAVSRLTMKLAAGSLETIWHHNEAVQVTRFLTSRAERQDIEVETER